MTSSRARAILALSPLVCGAFGCLERPDVLAHTEKPEVPVLLDLTGDIEVQDPTLIRVSNEYRLFGMGPGIAQRSSPDLLDFRTEDPVFSENPAWIEERVPGATHLWSPDVSRFGDLYHLYYAASTFGDDRSCIGHATAEDPTLPDAWTDRGEVICSNADGTAHDWNAIDPNLFLDGDTPWLVFGSYLSGIKLTRLDATGSSATGELVALATRSGDTRAVQASSLFQHGEFYYLFSSFDGCCRGVDSTHKIMVGRAEELEGPYVDREGVPLLEGGGSLLLESDERFRGPGSNTIFADGSERYNVFHAYDAEEDGRITLRISTLVFDAEGWPVSAGP
jgi:arabinan endo-1,5-alpha-L-arabinosidase